MADYRNVLIYAEVAEGRLASITKELLGGGRRLADELGEELHVLFMGGEIGEALSEALALRADKAYVIENPKLRDYDTDLYNSSLAQLVEKVRPRVLLFGHTDRGADLGPRLAFRLNRAIATDCVELAVQPGTGYLLRTKPVYGGVAMATYVSEGFPQMATVRPKSLPPAEKGEPHGATVPVQVDLERIVPRTTLLDRVMEEVQGIKLEDADVIVSGGRGIGSADGFKELQKLARLLKGTVGGSRVAVDNGWVPTSLQVGLTGTIVAPTLYFAVGISGASQHMTGCSRSKIVVAINKDAAAPIFKYARFGVVGDWKLALPAFIGKLETLE